MTNSEFVARVTGIETNADRIKGKLDNDPAVRELAFQLAELCRYFKRYLREESKNSSRQRRANEST